MKKSLKPRRDFGSPVAIGLILALALFVTACDRTPSEKSAAAPAATDPIASAKDRVKADPSFENYTALGLAFAKAERNGEALEAFERSLAINPRSPFAYNNVCAEKVALGEWAEAIRNCRKALEFLPDFEQAKNNLARAESGARPKIGDSRARAAGKDVDRNRIDLGMDYYRRGMLDEAVATWRMVPKGSVQFATAQNNLASIFIVRRQFDLAENALGQALRLEPQNPLFKNNREWLHSEMKHK